MFIVAITAFPVAAGGASGRLLVISRRGKTVAVITGIAAILNIGLNIALIPVVGIFGAGLATFLSYGVMAFLQRRCLPKDHAWHGPPVSLVLSVGAGVAFAAASMLLPQTLDWNIARAVVAVACVPWFFLRLRQARGGAASDSAPVTPRETPAPLDHSAVREAAARAAAVASLKPRSQDGDGEVDGGDDSGAAPGADRHSDGDLVEVSVRSAATVPTPAQRSSR